MLLPDNSSKSTAMTVYNIEYIQNISNKEIQFSLSDQAFFEQVLLEIGGLTISFSANGKSESDEKEKSLIQQILYIENIVQEVPCSSLLEDLKTELEKIHKEKFRGIVLRSQATWVDEGEKPTKYFCTLEKRNYVNKTISKIRNDIGDIITEQKNILENIYQFYKSVYKSRDDTLQDVNLEILLAHASPPKLSDEQSSF